MAQLLGASVELVCECGLEHTINIDEYEEEEGAYGVAEVFKCTCGRSVRASVSIGESGDLSRPCGNCKGLGSTPCPICEGRGSIE